MGTEETPLKQIRTFQGDVAEALEKQQESLVSIQRREQVRRGSTHSGADTSLASAVTRKEFFFLFLGSILLVIMGSVGAWYGYNEFIRKTSAPIIAAPVNRFLSVNEEVELDLTDASRERLINTLSETATNLPSGEIRHLVLRKMVGESKELISTSEFMKMLATRAPGSLVRAFDPLFMFGILGKSDFLIFKLTSFENAFAGMLLWEKSLIQDLGPLFTTRELLRDLPQESAFTDLTDRNKDIRVLVVGIEPVLLYSFFDNNMLIITDNLETLRTIMYRLTREKLSR